MCTKALPCRCTLGPLHSVERLFEILLPIRHQAAATIGVEIRALLLRPTIHSRLDPPFHTNTE